MFEIDFKNLKIKNKNKKIKKNSLVINITSDWAPIIPEISRLMVKKKQKYYGDLAKYFKKNNLNITNLETVIDNDKRFLNKNAPRFINKPDVLGSLKSINTNLVCLANNHVMDNGNEGLKKTIYYLKKYKINYVGADLSENKIYKPFLFKRNKQKIAIINTAEGEEANEKYNNNIGSSDVESYRVIDQIRNYKKEGYLVILIAHAGVEYIPTPPPYIKKIFKNFADQGVDLIVGHHPHVSQGFEIYKNCPIFYSLGNFTMWRNNLRKNCYESFFLNIEIQDNILSTINMIPFKIKKNGLELSLKKEFSQKIIRLNKLLPNSKKIWNEYVNRKNSKITHFTESISFFYNFKEYQHNQINKHLNLSKKYLDLDSFKNDFCYKSNYKSILDEWDINYANNFLLKFKNILSPFYKFLLLVKKKLIILKKNFF